MALPLPNTTPPLEAVRISSDNDVLLLEIGHSCSFDAIRAGIRNRFSEMETWRGRDARIDLGDRNIDLFDLRRLVHILKDEFDVNAAGLYCGQEELNRFAERELKLKVYPRVAAAEPIEPPQDTVDTTTDEILESAKPNENEVEVEEIVVVEKDIYGDTLYQESQTEKVLTLKRSLRSGQKVRYAGDVVIYGDINPGAEVIAGGNVLVMGALKGLCHAGARGDDSALIIAFDFRPPQIRIGRKIAIPPERASRPPKTYVPEIAWVRGGEILIEPYAGHLP